MNSNKINDYILNLENENCNLKKNNDELNYKNNEYREELVNLKKNYDELNYKNNEYKEELDNLIKVSIITNLNKQLKEKQDLIIIFDNEIKLLKNKLKNNVINEPIIVSNVINEPIIVSNVINEPIIDIDTNKKIKSKHKKECNIIKYKNKEYLLDIKTNFIFNIEDTKLSNNIGNLINGKIKLNK